jgi:hypothetical protein
MASYETPQVYSGRGRGTRGRGGFTNNRGNSYRGRGSYQATNLPQSGDRTHGKQEEVKVLPPLSHFNLRKEDLVKEIGIIQQLPKGNGEAIMKDFAFVASYNWVDGKDPVIYVPGMLPLSHLQSE